jgi:hypothetical protein
MKYRASRYSAYAKCGRVLSCRGQILPELTNRIVLSDLGTKSLDNSSFNLKADLY